MAKWYNEKENEEILKKIEEIKGDVSAFAKVSIDTSLSVIDKSQNERLDRINESIEHLSNEHFTSKNRIAFKFNDCENAFKVYAKEVQGLKEEIEGIEFELLKFNSRIDTLFLLIGIVGFAVLGDIIWTLINL